MATTVKILSATRFVGYKEMTIEVKTSIPASLNSLPNKKEIAESYKGKYPISKVEGDDIYFNIKIGQIPDGISAQDIGALIMGELSNVSGLLGSFTIEPIDDLIGKTLDITTSTWTYQAPQIP